MLHLVVMEHRLSNSKEYPACTTLIRGQVEPVDRELRHHEHLNKAFFFALFEDEINNDNIEDLLMERANDIRKAYALPLTVENAHKNPA